jgi:CBS domain-containing protein
MINGSARGETGDPTGSRRVDGMPSMEEGRLRPPVAGTRCHNTVTSGRGLIMTTARDIMTRDVTCVGEKESLAEAARKMAGLNVGSLPICGEDNRLHGMLTDRDIVVKVLGQGRNPVEVPAGELAQGKPVTIGADDDAAEVLRTMAQHRVRRLPVIDGHQLVGIVAVADVARALPDRPVGDLIDAISE